MWRTASREITRSDESLAQALKIVPAINCQRHVRILGSALGIQAVRMKEKEIARGGAYQQQWCLACFSANRREQLCQGHQNGAIRQVERGVGHGGVERSRGTERPRLRGGRRRPAGLESAASLRSGSSRSDA